ncbi:9331_t:CDS:2 [Dentiscutata erythropus]|uniref:9331_t:CDS:1 n=1 Tax=Dentiscutata erythropus TaxID=1348616 RepID=A0A9N9FL51_9GLOM|nr:9331_t:CDS:2 [Dentiscutata erythropus]
MTQNLSNSKKDLDGKKPISSKNTAACSECKRRKVKCDYEESKGSCKICFSNKLECKFEQQQKRGPKKALGSTTGMPSNIEFQNWGKKLWELLGKDNGNFTGSSLNNGQVNPPNGSHIEISSKSEQGITSGGNLVNGDLDGNHSELTLFPQENPSVNFNDNTLVRDESMLSTVNGDFAGDFLTSREQTFSEVRPSRTISRQQNRLSRSPSRENRQTRQETRNREPISRSPTSTHSDGDRPNLTLQIPNDRLQIPIDRVYYSPNHTEYEFSFNHSISNNSTYTSTYIPSPNIPLIDFDDANQISSLINSTTNLQTTPLFNLEEISQYSTDPQAPFDFGIDWQSFFEL